MSWPRFKQAFGFLMTVVGVIGTISIGDDAEAWFRLIHSLPRGVWVGLYVVLLLLGLALLFDLPARFARAESPAKAKPSTPLPGSAPLPTTSSSPGRLPNMVPMGGIGALRAARLRELHEEGTALRSAMPSAAVVGDGGLHSWENRVIDELGDDTTAVAEFLKDSSQIGVVIATRTPRVTLTDRLANLSRLIAKTSSRP